MSPIYMYMYTAIHAYVDLFVSSLMQVEVYNMGMLLAGGSGTVVLQRGQAVPGRFTIATPHEKVCPPHVIMVVVLQPM